MEEIKQIHLYEEDSKTTSDTLICYGFKNQIPECLKCEPMEYAMMECLQNLDNSTNIELIKVNIDSFEVDAMSVKIYNKDNNAILKLKTYFQSKFKNVAFQIMDKNGDESNQINYDRNQCQNEYEYSTSSENDADQESGNDDYFNIDNLSQTDQIETKRIKKDKKTLKLEMNKRMKMKQQKNNENSNQMKSVKVKISPKQKVFGAQSKKNCDFSQLKSLFCVCLNSQYQLLHQFWVHFQLQSQTVIVVNANKTTSLHHLQLNKNKKKKNKNKKKKNKRKRII